MCRDEVLRQHPWNFAVKRIILAENLLTRSEEFDRAAWIKTGTTVQADEDRGPDGNRTADLITATSGGNVAQSVAVPDDSQTYTLSVFMRQGSAAVTRLQIELTGGSTPVTETIDITWNDGPSSSQTVKITNIIGPWYRFSFQAVNNSTGNQTLTAKIFPAETGSGTAFIWGAQVSRADEEQPYCRTDVYGSEPFVPSWGYSHSLPLPCDFLRMVRTKDLGQSYRIEGRKLQTNAQTFKLEYIGRVEDTCVWDSIFQQAMVYRLAAELAFSIKGDVSLKGAMHELYEHYLNEARWADSKEQQQPDETLEGHTWLEARLGGVGI